MTPLRLDTPFKAPTDAITFCIAYQQSQAAQRIYALQADVQRHPAERAAEIKTIEEELKQSIDWLTWLSQEVRLTTEKPLIAITFGMLAFNGEDREAFAAALDTMRARIKAAESGEEK